MFATATKDAGPIAGPRLLAKVSAEIALPIVPIGGITADNVAQLVAAGARRVAVSSAICTAADPKSAAEAIKAKLPALA